MLSFVIVLSVIVAIAAGLISGVFGHVWRLVRVTATLVRYDVLLPAEYYDRYSTSLQAAHTALSIFAKRRRGRSVGERLAKALERLGPAYVKVGQFLATRPDMIGYDWTQMYTEVASADQVLFYQGGTWQWADWAANYVADLGGNDYLLENMGLMLFPAMTEEEGPLTLTHPLSYMISSSSEYPEVAMALLAAVTTVEANNRHAIESFHLGILNAQVEAEPYKSHPVLSTAHYMLDYTRTAPNHPSYSAWANAYWLGITAAHTGEATPEEAVQLAVETLQNELGDGITIR